MKTLIVILALCFVCFVGQAQQVQGEPAALTKAREKYQRDVAPITKAYLEKLEALKKEFGAKGDVTAMNAVQEEISTIKPEPEDAKRTLVGVWDWRGSEIVVVEADGKARDSDGRKGKWVRVKEGTYKITWDSGPVDTVIVLDERRGMVKNARQGEAQISKKPKD